ncbi:hypothetical protein JTB14_001660 [Gonioctena quinquepunctata]|nr:hypothetical protein JTB14_001660 [Gonioctena quinquepunctata]
MDDCLTALKKLLGANAALYEIESNLNKSILQTLRKCSVYCSNADIRNTEENKLLEIDTVIDFLHDELNTGHWSEVPLYIRHYFTLASFFKSIILLTHAEKYSVDVLKICLKCLDMGLLLGAPLEKNPELLASSAKYVMEKINELESKSNQDAEQHEVTSKRKLEETNETEFKELKGKVIPTVECPSLEFFNNSHFVPQMPVKLQGCMGHWPATKKWLDVNYLLKVAGDRTVPIEIGSHYVDENWSQKLMTLKEFVTRHYLSENNDIGYLAQHNLFEQITELKEDILIPEYCCLSLDYDNSIEPDINAWFGPKGTVSPLHHDPKNNILAQIYGTKKLVLFPPGDTPYLYPHEGKLLNNTAQVDPLKPDSEKFPEFSKSTMYKCILEPGECYSFLRSGGITLRH